MPDPNYFYDPVSDIPLTEPLIRSIRVNMAVVHNSRYLFGQNTNNLRPFNPADPSTYPQVPVEMTAMQGNEYGWGQVAVPYLLPQNGLLKFEIFNFSPLDVVVAAAIYGLKVQL